MRESLFRAAQQGEWHTTEERVGQRQSPRRTREVWEGSWQRLEPLQPSGPPPDGAVVAWLYPRRTAAIIDRANCADRFLRADPQYRVVTEHFLDGDESPLSNREEKLLLFCPFDAAMDRLTCTEQGQLAVHGRRIDVVASEMTVGYLARAGHTPHPARPQEGTLAPRLDGFRTRFVNGTGITLLKAAQLALGAREHEALSRLGVAVPDFALAWTREEIREAVLPWLADRQGVVLRPFAASRGAGVTFLGPNDVLPRAQAIDRAVDELEHSVLRAYGQTAPYPVTVSPFVESMKLDGRVCDLRMFVTADPETSGLRALPGMVRTASQPFSIRGEFDAAMCSSSFSGTADHQARAGLQSLPLTAPHVQAALRLTGEDLVRLGQAASLLWAAAVADARQRSDGPVPFAYGSVDFLLTDDGRAWPIEMNGANVGAHSCVHPLFVDAFPIAMCAALKDCGF
ncbi:hypothetical protein [Streptomyces lunalinharesii]|uniref:ATP-grasp domain-containing protein n=1 Tax=Streptomyces lunalinharesii TaxID=333384 RepID=A0ABN3SML9_9ACTN